MNKTSSNQTGQRRRQVLVWAARKQLVEQNLPAAAYNPSHGRALLRSVVVVGGVGGGFLNTDTVSLRGTERQ